MAQNVDTIFPLIDLGKAANFPYATIEPEVRPSTFVSRSTIEFFTIGSSCSCPRCSIRLAMRALQTRLPRSRTPDLHRYRWAHRCKPYNYSTSPRQVDLLNQGRFDWCRSRKRVPLSRTCRRRHLPGHSCFRRRRSHPRRGRRRSHPRHGNHPKRTASQRHRVGAETVRWPQEDRPESREQLSCGQSKKRGDRTCFQSICAHTCDECA